VRGLQWRYIQYKRLEMNEAEMNAVKAKESGRMKWDETNEMRCGPEI
jgi:hypothetical protein